jgi:hypothetical protein
MSNFILIYVQVSNFIQTQSIRGEGVENRWCGGGEMEDTGGVQAG